MSRDRTQVGIIGAGPAGLLLGQILSRAGIDAVLLEHDVVRLLRDIGLGHRLDQIGLEHGGIYLQFARERHHLDFRDLAGRTVTIYAQTEIVKDAIAARLAAGLPLEFEVDQTALHDVTTERPWISYLRADGEPVELICDVIAGCDGFYGPSRAAVPEALLQVHERSYPYAW